MASILTVFLVAFVAAAVILSVVFVSAKRRGRYDVIDAAWGMTFVAIALSTYLGLQQTGSLQLLLLTLVAIWGVRLSWHIYRRYRRSREEDHRYTQLRKDYMKKKGGVAWNMYAKVYLVQAVLAVVVSTPVIIVMGSEPTSIGALAIVGTVVWAIGFFFEAVGDYQLGQFVANPANKGKLMTTGLWRYTRHPNYFGELTQWWGVYIIAWSVQFGWAGLIGPLVITWLLVFISGVPLTERHFRGRPGWDDYKRNTSKLLPMLPKTRD